MQPLSLQLNWKIGSDMPAPMSTHIQSVEIHGTMYVGGGVAGLTKYDYVVMAYNTKSCQWSNLPSYNTRGFAMTALNNKLVLVSGQTIDDDDTYSKELGVFQSDSNQWDTPILSYTYASMVSFSYITRTLDNCCRRFSIWLRLPTC